MIVLALVALLILSFFLFLVLGHILASPRNAFASAERKPLLHDTTQSKSSNALKKIGGLGRLRPRVLRTTLITQRKCARQPSFSWSRHASCVTSIDIHVGVL